MRRCSCFGAVENTHWTKWILGRSRAGAGYSPKDFKGAPMNLLIAAAQFCELINEPCESSYVRIVPMEHLTGESGRHSTHPAIIHEECVGIVEAITNGTDEEGYERLQQIEKATGVYFERHSSWASYPVSTMDDYADVWPGGVTPLPSSGR